MALLQRMLAWSPRPRTLWLMQNEEAANWRPLSSRPRFGCAAGPAAWRLMRRAEPLMVRADLNQ
jgi:hypothetical protein